MNVCYLGLCYVREFRVCMHFPGERGWGRCVGNACWCLTLNSCMGKRVV